jgi:hypothetical protein
LLGSLKLYPKQGNPFQTKRLPICTSRNYGRARSASVTWTNSSRGSRNARSRQCRRCKGTNASSDRRVNA